MPGHCEHSCQVPKKPNFATALCRLSYSPFVDANGLTWSLCLRFVSRRCPVRGCVIAPNIPRNSLAFPQSFLAVYWASISSTCHVSSTFHYLRFCLPFNVRYSCLSSVFLFFPPPPPPTLLIFLHSFHVC